MCMERSSGYSLSLPVEARRWSHRASDRLERSNRDHAQRPTALGRRLPLAELPAESSSAGGARTTGAARPTWQPRGRTAMPWATPRKACRGRPWPRRGRVARSCQSGLGQSRAPPPSHRWQSGSWRVPRSACAEPETGTSVPCTDFFGASARVALSLIRLSGQRKHAATATSWRPRATPLPRRPALVARCAAIGKRAPWRIGGGARARTVPEPAPAPHHRG